jgi:putative drug exporter of the RND superfamily
VDPRERPAAGPVSRAYAFVVVGLRYPILLGWIAAVVAAVMFLPPLASSGGLTNLIPAGSPAARAESDATRLFGFPLDAGVAVVQRDPRGLPSATEDAAIRAAISVDEGQSAELARELSQASLGLVSIPPDRDTGIPGLMAAVPLPSATGLLSGKAATPASAASAAAAAAAANGRSTTLITFLYFSGGTSFAQQTAGAHTYASRFLKNDVVGVTGVIPAQAAQGSIITNDLGWVELFTVLAIALIVGVRFRSLGAPLAALLCAGAAYLLAVRIVAWFAQRMGVTLPPDLEPVLVVLLLGVTTDYSVFFLDGMRARLADGYGRIQAARLATAESAPMVAAAGLIVAAGTASLVVARTQFLHAFGPGLALTVLTAMAVSMTLGPALIAVFGGLLFRGAEPRRGRGRRDRAAPGRAGSPEWNLRARAARLAASRPMAFVIVAACTAGLLAAALGARELRVGSPLIRELPASAEAVRANAAASAGFAPGIMSPTEILVIGPGVAGQAGPLARLQQELARQPGVAELAGPASLPAAARSVNPMLARSSSAARYLVIEKTDGMDAVAISRVNTLREDLPALGRAAGLAGVRFEVAGQTALTSDAIGSIVGDLARVALAIMLVTFVLLAVFLRSLLAPVYLLAASVLAVFAALGLTVLICQGILGQSSLVYFVPFAAGVLLVSLCSDYNVFVVGRIWEEARRRPVRDAVAIAAPRASRAITTAGVALAASFALLAVIPLEQFRQIAIAMAAGVIIDAIVVRSLLVSALVALFGRAGMWPGNRPVEHRPAARQRPARAPAAAGRSGE